MKPSHTILAFLACALIVLAGVAWISKSAIDADRAEAEARGKAALEENIRLALWRMDSSFTPVIARESAGQAWSRPAAADASEGVEEVLLHFVVDEEHLLSSPELDEGAPSVERRRVLERRLEQLRAKLGGRGSEEILAALRGLGGTTAVLEPRPPLQSGQAPAQGDQSPVAQLRKSSVEWQMRSRSVQQAANNYNPKSTAGEAPAIDAWRQARKQAEPVSDAAMTPLWIRGELLLARRRGPPGREAVQGAWLDWARISSGLLVEVQDLLPRAQLLAVEGHRAAPEPRMLASLPARLVLDEASSSVARPPLSTSVLITLAVAWSGLFLAAAAVAVLLAGTVALSERRAVFVSAVTHELRTPLTTFRLYTEMLVGGMVPDDRKVTYLETLRREAVRLSHLVENVLAYAKLERGSGGPGRAERLLVGELVERCRPRLEDRAAQAEMTIALDPLPGTLHADPGAVEQILFNLVDNACKYASGATDRRIHLSAALDQGAVALRVHDHGPGVPPSDRRRLFSPFSKSAQRAAASAPGVGLGLALSRRLARTMGGDLALEAAPSGQGACFVLRLPAV
jgi:signal transduction histidine kinase